MALAQMVFDLIYPDDPTSARSKIRGAILKRFADTQSRVGHCIDERWIIQQLLQSLNPKERLEVDATIDALVGEGLITTDQRMSMTVLVLTQAGFDTIYRRWHQNPTRSRTKRMLATARIASVVSLTLPARRRLIRDAQPKTPPANDSELEALLQDR